MYVFLVAGADETYDASAYSFSVGNLSIQSDRRYGWTVVEAYLNGFLQLSNFIIKEKLYRPSKSFILCTASQPVIKLIKTDFLGQLKNNSWRSLDGKPIFYVPILKELYYHKLFYEERGITWDTLTELGDMEYRLYEQCQEKVTLTLTGGT